MSSVLKDLAWTHVNLKSTLHRVMEKFQKDHAGIAPANWHKELSKKQKQQFTDDILKIHLPTLATRHSLSSSKVKELAKRYRKLDFTQALAKPKVLLDISKDIHSQVNEAYKENIDESWLPSEFSSELPRGLVSKVSKALKWDIGLAYAFAVALLEDVNAHGAAKKVNDLLDKDLG